MTLLKRYPEMKHIFSIYFGQDFDLFGNTIPEIVSCYKKDAPYHYEKLIQELADFRKEYPNNLDVVFKGSFCEEFSPEGWGHTAASFLDEIQHALNEKS